MFGIRRVDMEERQQAPLEVEIEHLLAKGVRGLTEAEKTRLDELRMSKEGAEAEASIIKRWAQAAGKLTPERMAEAARMKHEQDQMDRRKAFDRTPAGQEARRRLGLQAAEHQSRVAHLDRMRREEIQAEADRVNAKYALRLETLNHEIRGEQQALEKELAHR